MRVHALLAFVVALGVMGGAVVRAEEPAAGSSTLESFERDVENLHQQINKSLVRVSVAQSAASVLDPSLRAEFDKWVPPVVTPPVGGGGSRRGGGEGRGGDRTQTRPDNGGLGGGPGGLGGGLGGAGFGGFGGRGSGGEPGGGGMTQRVRMFIQARIEDRRKSTAKADQDEVEKLRALLLRIDLSRGTFQGDMSAVVLDAQGHALVLTGLLREAHSATNPVRVTLSDGSQTNASFVGANLYGNYTVVKLDNAKGTVAAKWSTRKVAPGQILMTTTAGPGIGALIVANGKLGEALPDDRIALPAEDRSGVFVHDVRGALVAVMTSSGGIGGGERYATTAARMQREIDYIVTQNKDIEPRALGLKFSTQPGTALGPRKVLVDEVTPKSLAEVAALKKGDVLVSIDGRPISELVAGDRETTGMLQLKVDLLTRSGSVPLVVNRDGKDVSLSMPLK